MTSRLLFPPAVAVATLALAGVAVASTTIPIKDSQVPVRASEFAEHEDCAFPGLATQTTQWGWHFVLPGGEATFVSLTAEFEDAGTVTLPGSDGAFVQDGKGAVIWTATDDTLLAAEATIEGSTPQGDFVLSHTCLPAPTQTPTPEVSGSQTATPTPEVSGSQTSTPTPEVSGTETATPSGTPSATVSGVRFTNTPSGSISPTVLGVKQTKGGVAGTALPSTGSALLGLTALSALLLATGVVLTSSRPKGRHAR